MWYRDIANRSDAREVIAAYFDREPPDSILAECRDAHARGLAGESILDGFEHRGEYNDLRTLCDDSNISTDDEITRLVYDAWLDGIQTKNRVTVQLDSQTCDSICTECGGSLRNGAEKCTYCHCTEIAHQISVTVVDPYASYWAEGDQTLDGSYWETNGPDLAWNIISARPGLAAELKVEGYKLDLSCYSEDE